MEDPDTDDDECLAMMEEQKEFGTQYVTSSKDKSNYTTDMLHLLKHFFQDTYAQPISRSTKIKQIL